MKFLRIKDVLRDKLMYAYDYPRPAVAVDLIVVAERCNDYSHILLIERGKEPHKGRLAFPGGFLNMEETGLQGALREFKEECSSELPKGCVPEFFKVADKVDRDPRGRVISFVYEAIFSGHPFPVKGADDAAEAIWVPLTPFEFEDGDLAFDHREILDSFLESHDYLIERCDLCGRINCCQCPCR